MALRGLLNHSDKTFYPEYVGTAWPKSIKKKRIVLYSKEQLNNAQRSTYKLSLIYAVRTQGHLFAFKREKTASFCIQSTKPL